MQDKATKPQYRVIVTESGHRFPPDDHTPRHSQGFAKTVNARDPWPNLTSAALEATSLIRHHGVSARIERVSDRG